MTATSCKTSEFHNCGAKGKELDIEENVVFDSNYIKFKAKAK